MSWNRRGGEVVEQVIRPTGLVDPVHRTFSRRADRCRDLLRADQEAGRGQASACW